MWKASLLLLVGLTACHSSGDMGDMSDSIDDVRLEINRHAEASQAAPTIEYMRQELTRHRYEMMPILDDVDHTMSSMSSHCDGTGLTDMLAMHDAMHDELGRHLTSMDKGMELPAAKMEVERYAAAMRFTMDGMFGSMGSMNCH